MKLTLNISPCPNDTFMFEAMIAGRVDTEGLSFEVRFADIEELNESITAGGAVHVSKISYAVLPLITRRYALLECGSALGRGNGPLMVGRESVKLNNNKDLRVAIPGVNTTANMLLSRLFPYTTQKTPVIFSGISEAVASSRFDAGVLIHESRFTYREKGLRLLCDLGREWENRSSMPLPLGGIVVSRTLPWAVQKMVERVLGRSIEYALQNPLASAELVRSHAQELSPEVTGQHIEMFVNEYSVRLGADGEEAVRLLTGLLDQNIFIRD